MNPMNAARTPYRVSAMAVEACNCPHGCACQFTGIPNDGFCEFIIGFQVTSGRFGDVTLDGVRAAIAAKYPGAIHEGRGRVLLFVDDKASDEQTEAFATIVSGRMGGMPWEALAGTVERFDGPIRRPVHLDIARERSRVDIPGVLELHLTPLVDVVSGAEKEVHIVYPKGGFFWNDAHIATSTSMRAAHGDFQLEWPKRYASTAPVNWTNQ